MRPSLTALTTVPMVEALPTSERRAVTVSESSSVAIPAQGSAVEAQRDLLTALDRALAVIEFSLDGTILTANDNFLAAVGYTLAEVQGRHHRIFCDDAYAQSDEYVAFWNRLALGSFQSGEFLRRTKDGTDLWLQATYNPVIGEDGRPQKVVKLASDITRAKHQSAEFQGKVAAIDRAQAVVEFALDGTVLTGNRNFLETMGYQLDEVQGRHHRVFCEPAYAASPEYEAFWERLGRGAFEGGEYLRYAKGGREVWLQATYNPILDDLGRPLKVVKFASDITEVKLRTAEIEARLAAVDRAQAAVEFDLEGIVLGANENFLRTMGYSLREIMGQHHSTFCTPDYTRSAEYRDFWLRLRKGEVIAGRFERVGNYGREVHIQATYNPVMDPSGRPIKVVKYAYDVTSQVQREAQVATGTAGMTSAVRELSGAIEDISRTTADAGAAARSTQVDAEQGAEALRAALQAIALIQKSSTAIGEIVRVMSDIANQTNLLAFNASIEAARAGEHGVGFSIVAGEVRKLAERSFEAAQQVGELIEQSVERVQEGAQVSSVAEAAFVRIAEGVSRTGESIDSIAATTKVQQQASQDVRDLIAQMSAADES